MIQFIDNIGDYFASNYFDQDFHEKVIAKTGHEPDTLRGIAQRIAPLRQRYERYKLNYTEGRLRKKDRIKLTHDWHTEVLTALGYQAAHEYDTPFLIDDQSVIPVRNTYYRGDQLHLIVMEMQSMIPYRDKPEPEGLFEQCYESEEQPNTREQRYHRSQWSSVFTVPSELKISPQIINEAISTLFMPQNRNRQPAYVLLCAGNYFFLIERDKWFRGSYLVFDIELLFMQGRVKREYYHLWYALLAHEHLAPTAQTLLLEEVDEDAHRSAYEVTKDLKEGVIFAVESLANEAVYYFQSTYPDEVAQLRADALKDDCLTYVYRLLFLFYAEAREDLDILPIHDAVYRQGYSLHLLRELEQVPLNTASSRDGYFFHQSLSQLFVALFKGRNAQAAHTRSFVVRRLDSPLFDDGKRTYLPRVKVRNHVWQAIIRKLSLSKQVSGKTRGRISYANLGINQLGSVYESLLAFRGFFAEEDYIEVHRKRKARETSEKVAASDGTHLVPRHRIDDFDPLEIYTDAHDQQRIIPKGTFVYRLSGRDRQKSASYYTPEVLTQSTVKYTLKPILDRLKDSEDPMRATDLLQLKILEPAMGAAAFHNEVIHQIAEAYLAYRQQERNKKINPDKYRTELQRVKAYIALRNVYGVDINPTAIELGKLSLWLNVIHKDMETPFFGYRLGTGNAVVGAWFKAYKEREVAHTDIRRKAKKQDKKEWWKVAPQPIKWSSSGIRRGKGEVYHFLLPHPDMAAAANLKLIKEAYPAEVRRVREWRAEMKAPYGQEELLQLRAISARIDDLIEVHYQHQRRIHRLTAGNITVYGYTDEPTELPLQHYAEKERLHAERADAQSAYYKLKLVMDYWCALWYWEIEAAKDLPSRAEWYADLLRILEVDAASIAPYAGDGGARQQSMFDAPAPTLWGVEEARSSQESDRHRQVQYQLIQAAQRERTDLFGSERLDVVHAIAQAQRFFHYPLEFVEVFVERGGFDVIVGNPPWLKLQFEEKDIMGERSPELLVRKVSAPTVRQLRDDYLSDPQRRRDYFQDYTATEAAAAFMNAYPNYPLLVGQQTNLYKCLLENGLQLTAPQGLMGLIHPEGIYDDPKAQPLRRAIYPRLVYHFQYQNEFNLFAEVAHREKYSLNIYKGSPGQIDFYTLNNLFTPQTIDGCFLHDGQGAVGGIKVQDRDGKFRWNVAPHRERLVRITEAELQVLARTFEGHANGAAAKLVSLHAQPVLEVIRKLGTFPTTVGDVENKSSEGWHETNAINDGNIARATQPADLDQYQLIYSGPHFFVANPFYKTPRTVCTEKGHYDVIDHTQLRADELPRTNYVPAQPIDVYRAQIKGFDQNSFLDSYKVMWRRRISVPGERTLMAAIAPPKSAFVNTVNAMIFREEQWVIELSGLMASLPFDFLIKTIGKGDFRANDARALPLGIPSRYRRALYSRVLLLNALTSHYAPLWGRQYCSSWREEGWSQSDGRLKGFDGLSANWEWGTPLRNAYARRLALVEIDVIVAQALGLTLDELELIYEIQFPVLQQNEEDTWYDQDGQIVFTCSRGLTGVGVDRDTWNSIRDMAAGESYVHVLETELYAGQEVVYRAPFTRCDRVADYRRAWAWFLGS